jgi:hypothetical protein
MQLEGLIWSFVSYKSELYLVKSYGYSWENFLKTNKNKRIGPYKSIDGNFWYHSIIYFGFHLCAPSEYLMIRFSSCQQNLIKTFHIEAIVALITKMALIFS